MGLIRKSLRAASFAVAPIPSAAGYGVKGESKKQRYLRQIAEAQAASAASRGAQPPASAVSTTQNGENPLDIARARYARGEITRAEFEEISAVLGPGPPN
jgi:hypothetical protein